MMRLWPSRASRRCAKLVTLGHATVYRVPPARTRGVGGLHDALQPAVDNRAGARRLVVCASPLLDWWHASRTDSATVAFTGVPPVRKAGGAWSWNCLPSTARVCARRRRPARLATRTGRQLRGRQPPHRVRVPSARSVAGRAAPMVRRWPSRASRRCAKLVPLGHATVYRVPTAHTRGVSGPHDALQPALDSRAAARRLVVCASPLLDSRLVAREPHR